MIKSSCHPKRKHRARGLCNACYLRENGGSKQWYRKNRELTIKRSALWNRLNRKQRLDILRRSARIRGEQVKFEVLSRYGKGKKPVCSWRNCYISDVDMLSIDHILNDGAKHRPQQKIGNRTGIGFYYHLKKLGFPKGFQTLCMNHQLKKEILKRRRMRRVISGRL
jgi:hypothetical protein